MRKFNYMIRIYIKLLIYLIKLNNHYIYLNFVNFINLIYILNYFFFSKKINVFAFLIKYLSLLFILFIYIFIFNNLIIN